MSVAYCIVAHTRPSQCRRLVHRLLDDDPTCRVLLHYDQRGAPLDLAEVASPRVQIMAERPLYWGGPEIVRLFVEMFQVALDGGCSYAVMLSGQEYPLRHVGTLEGELARYDVWPTDMRPLFEADGTCRWAEARRRYSYQWWHVDEPKLLGRVADRLAAKIPGAHESTPEPPLPYLVHTRMRGQLWWGVRSRGPGLPVYIGSQWFSLSARALGSICSAPSKVMRYFGRLPISDETCFHTILASVPELTFAPRDTRYLRFSERGLGSPDVLTTKDMGTVLSSGAHFGRKFDELVDSTVLDRLDSLSEASVEGL
jgi:Core-2/I-Branching enzyme